MFSPPQRAEPDPRLSRSHDPPRGGLPSPPVEYCDGQVPPALSHLDAFAQQGRLLAKELQDSRQRDHRLSRLPPYNVIRSLSRPRPGYFRSRSHDEPQPPTSDQPSSQGSNLEYETPRNRPLSEYPQFGSVPDMDTESRASSVTPGRATPASDSGSHDLEIRRTESPIDEPSSTFRVNGDDAVRYRIDAPGAFPVPSRGSSDDSASYYLNVPRNVGPPGSPLSRPSTGLSDTSDDEYCSSNTGSTFSRPRKLSSSSARSLQPSPLHSQHRRSPSANSQTSTSGVSLQCPSLNFSRPWSRTSNYQAAPALSPRFAPTSNPPGPVNRAHKPGPLILPSNIHSRPSVEEPPALSAQSNYHLPLPRGREVPVDLVPASEGGTPQLERQEPFFETPILSSADARQHGRPRGRSPSPAVAVCEKPPRFYGQHGPLRTELPPSSRSFDVERTVRASMEASKPAIFPSNDDTNFHGPSAESLRSFAPDHGRTNALTAEDHVAIGIECHEKGSLNESAYHLRNAARHNDPTGMLLYALACRHGWGMRPNQREGVRWLRKALDLVGMELVNDDCDSGSGPLRAQEIVKRMHRAQFALSVYELGVSHLNGWGIERDKTQALHCFEIASQWGDVDAMAETGYCYAEGVGCKKDLKKAAKFYRMAEANGMSMLGNSW